jgi:DNA repair exonuclease SbcCD ATPase subunit
MSKLLIDKIVIQNFLTYGDYKTEIPVKSLGPTLIFGTSVGGERNRSNGSGKSSGANALLWCIFGRLVDNPRPGDKVINWNTGKNCFVEVHVRDGTIIKRTRKLEGHSDLLIIENGKDVTQSITTNAQSYLNRKYNLDYNIFVSSVFCGQFGEPILKNQGAKRKATFEKMFGLSDLNTYADVAKKFLDEAINDQKGSEIKIETMKGLIDNISARVAENKERELNFEREKKIAAKKLNLQLEEAMKNLEASKPKYDVEEITNKWNIIDQINNKISSMREEIRRLVSDNDHNKKEIVRLTQEVAQKKEKLSAMEVPDMDDLLKKEKEHSDAFEKSIEFLKQTTEARHVVAGMKNTIKRRKLEIENITEMAGTICGECQQPVDGEHCERIKKEISIEIEELTANIEKVEELIEKTNGKIKELSEIKKPNIEAAKLVLNIISDLEETIKSDLDKISELAKLDNNDEIIQRQELIKHTIKSVEDNRPEVSREEISEAVRNYNNKNDELESVRRKIKEESSKENPYHEAVLEMSKDLDQEKAKLVKAKDEINEYNTIIKHLKYIRRAYFNRDKIKSFIIANMVPYLNRRIHYYLSAFGLQISLKFTNSLGIEMHKWDYSTCSGGEQKSIDVAVQLALYDLYTMMYGSQCNIMVLDEIDGSLDPVGVEYFVDIINNDFAHRIETILVISHKEEMMDAFPSKITIEKHIIGEIGNSHVVINDTNESISRQIKSALEEGIPEETLN